MRVILLILILSSCGQSGYEKAQTTERLNKERDSIKADSISKVFLSAELSEIKSKGNNNSTEFTKDELKAECQKMAFNCDFILTDPNYDGSINNTVKGASLFYRWGTVSHQIFESKDESIIETGKQIESRVIDIQDKFFPVLRKRFSDQLQKYFWEEDYKIYTRGDRNERIIIIHSSFVRNKEIKEFNKLISQWLIDFRFEKVIYNWCRGCPDSEVMDVSHLSDKQIGYYQ